MNVLVDTPVWSYALRSKAKGFEPFIEALQSLIEEYRVLMIGPIRQELLSGFSDANKFQVLKEKLSAFPNTEILNEDYVTAAQFFNQCRKNGIQGSHIDFLICAVAKRLQVQILTTDQDFLNYQNHLPIELHITI
ncbi:PIN domain-containing protein [bacterium]|jgi:predicted nucleic acid-binding protein|nr:PIN domain-containing protein [bacterium]